MLKPLNDKVVVSLLAPNEKSTGGIVLPIGSRDNRQDVKKGKIVATGPGRLKEDGTRAPMNVKVGEFVLVNWGGTDVEVGDEKYRIIQESDILAVLD